MKNKPKSIDFMCCDDREPCAEHCGMERCVIYPVDEKKYKPLCCCGPFPQTTNGICDECGGEPIFL